MLKKGQLIGTPFILIFALVLGALILLFGFNVIEKLVGYGHSVEVSKFITDLREDVEKYYYFEKGSSKEIRINLPRDIQFICFKQASTIEKISALSHKWSSMIEYDMQNNIFLFPPQKHSVFSIPHLGDLSLKTYCARNGETITIKSEGYYVSIG